MWNKALWYREYHQLGLRIWILPVVHFFFYGFHRMNEWLLTEPDRLERYMQYIHSPSDVFDGGMESVARYLLVLYGLLLSVVLISAERRNGKQEMLFSLPYKRTDIFMVKWLFGIALITGTLVLNTAIDLIISLSSPIAQYVTLSYYITQFLYTWVIVSGLFSAAMFVGSISGSSASHMFYLLMLFALPFYFWTMFWFVMDLHDIYLPNWLEPEVAKWFVLTKHIEARHRDLSLGVAVLYAVMLVGFAAAGRYMYSRNRTENNGRLMISKAWDNVLYYGFIVCFALLAGVIARAFSDYGLLSFYIGVVIGVLLGRWLIRALMNLRLKI